VVDEVVSRGMALWGKKVAYAGVLFRHLLVFKRKTDTSLKKKP
jgi:hypothetical protein